MMDYLQHLSEHIVPLVIGALLAAGYFLLFYPLATFRYRVADRTIEVQWIVLGFIPVSRRKIGLDQVEGMTVTPFLRCLWSGKGFHVFGNVFARRGVAILLKKGVLWTSFGKTVYVTPRDPGAFMAEVATALEASADNR